MRIIEPLIGPLCNIPRHRLLLVLLLLLLVLVLLFLLVVVGDGDGDGGDGREEEAGEAAAGWEEGDWIGGQG